jgi:glutathione peroxidase|tara:strand:- start:998 stop:1537 length:540 start_codon:yes stop_codon:yes gene_type:complete
MYLLKFLLIPITIIQLSMSVNNLDSIYDIKINNITGEPIELSDFKDKYLLFVNVASKCGFTDQYKDLQELHEKYKDDLIIVGLPCNQFGNQEPGNEEEISQFCQINYGVTFLLTEKIEVKGNTQHPIYKWLTDKNLNGVKSSTVRWNFQKYLLDPSGNLIDYWYSTTNPLSKKIIQHIQ